MTVPRTLRLVVGFAVALASGVGLVVGAQVGVNRSSTQSSARAVALGSLDDAYYDCLTTQARSLVARGETVSVNEANLESWVIVTKVLGSWAVLERRGSTSTSVPTVSLISRPGPGSCLGTVVTTTVTTPRGTVVVRRGRGASLLGHHLPPAPTL